LAVSVVNQWQGTFAQPASFQTMPPALQSVNVQLIPANSVGGGSGTPTAGNWLVTLVGVNEQSATAGFTVGCKDDIHSYWRPAKVSAAAALTRTSAWYTANLQRAPGYVYVCPNGALDAMSVLVLELAGAGPWDTLTVTPASNYAAGATSLNLSLGTPSAASFAIAAVTGDSTTAGQAFAPGSWTALHTVSATNGVDHTCDAVLTAAFLASNSGSLSVSASATSATDLSGVILELAVTGTNPVPSAGQGQNPNWAYMILEAAFGSGFETPEDQMTWVSLNDLANSGSWRRFWAWDDTSGVPYALGQLQSSTGTVQADNADGSLSPANPASLFYTSPGAAWSPLAAFYDAQVSAAAPLAWWKLADAAGSGTAADSSGNSHPGTATSVTFGSTNEAVSGNTAASFASASSSRIISSYNPSFTAFTVECWVNLNGLTQSGNPRLVASSHTDADSRGFQLYLDPTPHIYIGFNPGTANVKASQPLPATGWNYLAATYDGATLSLYVNGVLAGAVATGGTISTGTAAGIGLGYGAAYSGDFLNGLLAEAAVYGTALTSQQIAAHYTAGPAATGTPVRVRMALGTIAGTTYNRWYVWQRHGLAFPEKRNRALRGYVPLTLTDIWSVVSGSCPTPYRGEVQQDSPYAWWPMDDQPLSGGVQPASLRNAAAGNTSVLTIYGASGGVTPGTMYSTTGVSATSVGVSSGTVLPSVAVYAVAQQQGWMYGDPQSSPQSYSSGNPVTSSPGSAAWQQTGMQGNTGANGWFMAVNDTSFPGLSGGVSFGLWFNAAFFGTAAGWKAPSNTTYDICGQPYSVITLATLATASAPVALLQLDLSGHLILVTYNGATPTSHPIYSSSDLRSASWQHVMLTTNGSTWTVYVNGGLTAQVSGSGAGMTSAWTWLVINGDLGASGGSTLSAQQHGGNVAYSHCEVYPQVMPAWRVLAHYCAAATGFGVLPAPQNLALDQAEDNSGLAYTPDGSAIDGNYGKTTSNYTYSAVAVAKAGSFTSGPSARAVTGAASKVQNSVTIGAAIWVSWTSLAPQVLVYSSLNANAETNAATVAGSGDAFTDGFGATSTGTGVCQVSGGSGASPPSSPSALGDTVAQRIERVLGYGLVTSPNRAIDATANLLVQAATDIGGQQLGANCQNLVDSDNGLLFVDNCGTLSYRSRAHLASDTVTWFIGMNVIAGMAPFDGSIEWSSDPQRVWDAITVTPFSPDGASLASFTPASASGANASQAQFGPRSKAVTSYLQDASKQQAQASWYLSNFGILQKRGSVIAIDAASHPAAWGIVAGMNPSDIIQVYDQPLGSPATTAVFRVGSLSRSVSNGANGTPVRARLVIVAEPLPPAGYWT
jgi:Concanavalin A-like lectin/glucanases superfamily